MFEHLSPKERKKACSEKVREIQKFLKKKINWQPAKTNLGLPLNINQEYDGERYMILSSRHEKNQDIMEIIVFVNNLQEIEAIKEWGTAFKSITIDLTDFSEQMSWLKQIEPDLSRFK